MKRTNIALFVAICIVFTFSLCACSPNIFDTAVKNADNYTLVVSYDDENHKLSVAQSVEITNRTHNSFDSLKFHIYANAYREEAQHLVVSDNYAQRCYYNGESYGSISFDSVSVGENAVAFVIEGEDCDILSVPLSATLYPDECVTVSFVYEVQLANVQHRLGYGNNTVNCANFYPVLCNVNENGTFDTTPYYVFGDPFVSKIANFTVSVCAPKEYLVASSGTLIKQEQLNGEICHSYSAQAVRDFAFVLSKDFQCVTETVDNVTVNYYYFNDENALDTFTLVKDVLCFFNDKIGIYPYPCLTVVQADFCFGGMEYPALALVSHTATDYNAAVVHEMTHQWFYAAVGSNQITEPYLDEGLAEFLTLYYMDKISVKPLSESINEYMKSYATYTSVMSNYKNSFSTKMRPLYEFDTEQDYVYMTYVKGALMFNAVYENLNESRFFDCLGNYYDSFCFEIANLDDLITCFERTSRRSLNDFFRAYVDGSVEILELKQ